MWCHTRLGLLLRRRVHRQLLFQRSGNHSECRDRHPRGGHHAALPIAPADCCGFATRGRGYDFPADLDLPGDIDHPGSGRYVLCAGARTGYPRCLVGRYAGSDHPLVPDCDALPIRKVEKDEVGLTSLKFDRNKQAHLCMPTNLISFHLSASF